jgi:hypothetical protein
MTAMPRHCPACGYPTQAHERSCGSCDAGLQGEGEALKAQERWMRLSPAMKAQMEAEHARRCREWSENRDFYERKSVWKHLVAGAIIFGVAGAASGVMAVAYALAGVLGGKILNRRKGGLFLGTLVGAGVFVAVVVVRTGLVLCLGVETEAFLMNVALSHYADRIAGLVCPAAGGLLGYLIEHEFEARG